MLLLGSLEWEIQMMAEVDPQVLSRKFGVGDSIKQVPGVQVHAGRFGMGNLNNGRSGLHVLAGDFGVRILLLRTLQFMDVLCWGLWSGKFNS